MVDKKNSFVTPFSGLKLTLISFIISIILAETITRSFYALKKVDESIERSSAIVVDNDAYETDGEYRGKYDRWPRMRFSSFLSYYPLENYEGNGYVTNQYGFRYFDDFASEKSPCELRIFISGGSTAWGAGPSQNYIFTTLAEKILNEQNLGLEFRVISVGVGAYLSTHERILILNKVQNLDPDILIMFSGWNDTYAGYRGKRVIDDTWDYLDAATILAEHSNKFYYNSDKIQDSVDLPEYDDFDLKIYFLLRRALYNLKKPTQIENKINDALIEPSVIIHDLLNNIKAVHDASKRQNFSLVFYLQPTLYNTRKVLSKYELFLLHEGERTYVGFPEYNKNIYNIYREKLPKIAENLGVTFIDGDYAIQHESKTVFDDHVHFGDRGNQIIANHIVEIISNLINKKNSSKEKKSIFYDNKFKSCTK